MGICTLQERTSPQGTPGRRLDQMWSDERARVTGMWDTRAHAVVLIGKVCGHHEVDHGVIEELSKC